MKRSTVSLLLSVTILPALCLLRSTQGQSAFPALQPPMEGTRGPSALLFAPDGQTLYVAEQDENQVAVLAPDHDKILAQIPSGGEQPVALALSPDSRTLAVVNEFSGSLGIVDVTGRTLHARVPLPGEPYGVAIPPAGGQAFVSISALNQVAVVDLNAARVVNRIPVGRRPRALALTPDGNTLLCANMMDGSLSVIDVATQKERERIALPAINLRGLTVAPDGTHVYVTAQQPHNDVPTNDPETLWSNLLCIVRLGNGTGTVERVIALDQLHHGAADPTGVAIDSEGKTAYIALSGTHQVARVPLQPLSPASTAEAIRYVRVGTNPRALVLRPHSAEIWVGNHLGNSLTLLPLAPTVTNADYRPAHWVDLGPPSFSPNRRLKGRFLFTSAHITRGGRFTCETCHPDEASEGLSWKFAHVKGGVEVRNTRDLRATLLLTGPYGWDARDEDFEKFVNTEIVGLLKTAKMDHEQVHAFWDLINETSLPPNPYRNADGSLTRSAIRGKSLFEGTARCVTCHMGDERGGTEHRAWIGTTPTGMTLDIPHLVGVYDSAPYLHDGRAATLEEIFNKCNPTHRHGNFTPLTAAQQKDLLEYVREL